MKVFVEEQRFKKWIIASLIILPLVGGIIPLILVENDFPTFNSEGFWGLVILSIIVLLVLMLLLSIKLSTKINEQGIYYQYFPIHLTQKFISWQAIESYYLTKNYPFNKFGGYGGYKVSLFKNKGTTMNVGGKYGIQLILKNGKKILLGTQNTTGAENILKTYKQN